MIWFKLLSDPITLSGELTLLLLSLSLLEHAHTLVPLSGSFLIVFHCILRLLKNRVSLTPFGLGRMVIVLFIIIPSSFLLIVQ